MRVLTSQHSACTPQAGRKNAAQKAIRCRSTRPSLPNECNLDAHRNLIAHRLPVSACLAVTTVMALQCPRAVAAYEVSLTPADDSHTHVAAATLATQSSASSNVSLQPRVVIDCPELKYTTSAGPPGPVLVVTDLADATSVPASAYPMDTMVTGTYVPGPVEVGWQIYVGSAVAAFPFVIGAYEFGKRILIQQRYAPSTLM